MTTPWRTLSAYRIGCDPKCVELAEYWLSSDERTRNIGDFRLHVISLAEDIQRTLEDFSLPKE